MRSLEPTEYTSAAASALAYRFQCESITPLGVPVLPLEKMTAAISAGFAEPSRERAGASRAASSAESLSRRLKDPNRSSTKTAPGGAAIPAFSRNAREEITVRMPQRSSECRIFSAPAVKLRFTAVLPARVTPRLARAPPTEAGNNRPTEESSAQCELTQRLNNSAAVSARPKVNFRPVESASASADQLRRAARMNPPDKVAAAVLRYSTAALPSSSTRW